MGNSARSVISERPWRRPRGRGQAFVEFALIAPIFLALFFGIIEYALVDSSIGAYDFAAVAGARVGAIDGTAPNCAPTCGGGLNDATYGVDWDILLNGIQPHVSGLVLAQIVEVDVFQANETGGCYITTETFPCQTHTDIYTAASGTWQPGSVSNWPQSTRHDQLVDADYLGLRVVYRYTYLTALLATTSPALLLTAVSVQRIEPQAFQLRVPGPTVIPLSYTSHGAPDSAALMPLKRMAGNVTCN